MPQDVYPRPDIRSPSRPGNRLLHHLLSQRGPITLGEHPPATQMSVLHEHPLEPSRQGHVADPPPFGGGHLTLPVRPSHAQPPLVEIHVSPLQRHHLATAKASFPTQQH